MGELVGIEITERDTWIVKHLLRIRRKFLDFMKGKENEDLRKLIQKET